MNKITINEKEYPCGMTMGALLRFKQETGQDIGQVGGEDTSAMITLLWCCIKSACAAQKEEFPYSLIEFADSCNINTLNDFTSAITQSAEASKKK